MIVDEINVETKIENELKKLRYKKSYKGTQYLIYTIYILYKMNNDGNCELKSEVYPIVAQKFNTSVNNIKCNIRNATDKMYYDCEQDIVVRYVKTLQKPTPKIVIKSVLRRIKTNLF